MTLSPTQTRKLALGVTAGVAVVIVIPVLNLLPKTSAVYVSDFYLNLFGKYLALAILALGMDLLWGYAGILSLGQAVFLGLGGYTMGMHLMQQMVGQGKYGENIPDFMVWNQIKELPFHWKPFDSFPNTVLGILLVPTCFALVFGFLTFRTRIRGVYVSILTQALAFATWLLFNRNEMALGGTNGLTDYKMLLGFSLLSPATQRGLYVVTALTLVFALLACMLLVRSKFGQILRAVRDAETRLRFSGYSTTGYKVAAFSIAALLAGVAGALYVPQVGIITPNQIGVLPSLEVVVWVAVGGRGTLFGAVLGAIVVNAARSYLTAKYPELWPFVLGGLFVGVVLLFPRGLVGLPNQAAKWLERFRTFMEVWRAGTIGAGPHAR
ncbi:MAG: urea ABC transporter permease subunit UrtC [Nitrospirae bacterium]|nr:urea ABC transporter permease subunit UrtC [Nitrospirota bacterium]